MPLDSSTAITIGGIQCWDEGASEDLDRINSTSERRLCCAWNDRMVLGSFLMGGSSASGPVITTNAAARYPDATFLRAEHIHIDGEGVLGVGPHGMVSYQWAHLIVTYRTNDLSLTSEDIGTLSIDGSTQVIMPSQAEPTFKWLSDDVDLPPEATPGVIVATMEFVKSRRNLPAIPMSLILSLADHVNSTTFEGAEPGKVLFLKPSSGPIRVTANGLQNIDLTYSFLYHPKGHNKFLRPSTGLWEDIVNKGNGQPPHPEGDLNQLFAP